MLDKPLYRELQTLREHLWEMELVQSISRSDADPNSKLSLKEVIGEEGYQALQQIDPDYIPDDELFE